MNFNQIKFGKSVTYLDGIANYLKGAMVWGFKSKFKWDNTSTDIWGFANPNDIDPEAQAVYDRIIADGGVSNLTRLNYFVVGLKTIYGSLTNVPVCYDAHWIGYKLGSGTGATAGQAAAKLYSLTLAGDAVQSTAASQPLLLAHNGDNYWWGSGVAGNYVSTPNAAANQITGDIQIDFDKCNYIDLTNTGYIANKSNGASDASYGVALLGGTTGKFRFRFSSDGTNIQTFSSTLGLQDVGINANTTFYGRVTRSSSNGDIKFYYSLDGSTYTQLGTTITSTPSGLWNSSNILTIGTSSGASNNYLGKISRVKISNSIGGTPVVDFNPATYNASTSQTAWTSTTGEIWTISTGTAATGYKGVLVDRTIVMSDGVDDTLISGTLANNQYFSQHVALNPFDIPFSPGQYYVDGGGGKGLIYAGNNNIRSYNGTDLIFIGITDFRLQYFHADFNNASSNVYLNNSNNVSGATGTLTSTKSILFSNNGGSTFGCAIITTVISRNSAIDTTVERTAIYNFVKTLNNNAF